MGQEKSLPNRYNNSESDYKPEANHKTGQSHNSSSTPPLPSFDRTCYSKISTSSSYRSPSSAGASLPTSCNSSCSSSDKSKDRQKDYLSHHLYIKSYLDILEEDVKAKQNFKPARPGIRNYTPKILSDKKQRSIKEIDVWI